MVSHFVPTSSIPCRSLVISCSQLFILTSVIHGQTRCLFWWPVISSQLVVHWLIPVASYLSCHQPSFSLQLINMLEFLPIFIQRWLRQYLPFWTTSNHTSIDEFHQLLFFANIVYLQLNSVRGHYWLNKFEFSCQIRGHIPPSQYPFFTSSYCSSSSVINLI